MQHGGTDYCNMTAGLQATLPMLNPYIVDGYQSGDRYEYPYAGKRNTDTVTSSTEMTVHPGKLDIFNLSRKPGGKNPEIGEFMKQAFELKDKYADVINHGTFIVLDKEGDKNDDVIAFARHYNSKTLLVVANKNINRPAACKLKIPTLKSSQELKNLLPSYGQDSIFQAAQNELRAEIGPARIHVFEIDTPEIEMYAKSVYRQKGTH
jgi:maltooligosyltrehalose synthase